MRTCEVAGVHEVAPLLEHGRGFDGPHELAVGGRERGPLTIPADVGPAEQSRRGQRFGLRANERGGLAGPKQMLVKDFVRPTVSIHRSPLHVSLVRLIERSVQVPFRSGRDQHRQGRRACIHGRKEPGLSSRRHFLRGVVVAGQSVAGGVNEPFQRSGRTRVSCEIFETHDFALARAGLPVAIGMRPVPKLEGSGGGLQGLGHRVVKRVRARSP